MENLRDDGQKYGWGAGGTLLVGNDRYPITVVGHSKSGKSIQFTFDRMPNDGVYTARWSKVHKMFKVGKRLRTALVALGEKEFYQDPHF